MNEHEQHELVDAYLRRLAAALAAAPDGARRELLEDVRGHIAAAWESAPHRDRATLLNILERLGEPEDLAREEYARLGLSPARQEEGVDFLSVAAVVLTVLFWPVGVIVAWFSSRWSTRDKAIATLLPTLGLVLGLTFSIASYAGTPQAVVHQSPASVEREIPASPSTQPSARPPAQPGPSGAPLGALFATALAVYGFLGAPLTSAAYLGLRLRRRTGRSSPLVALLGAGLMVAILLLAVVAPAMTFSASGAAVLRPGVGNTQQLP